MGVEQSEQGELKGTLGSWPTEVGKVGVEVGRGVEVEEMGHQSATEVLQVLSLTEER